MKPDINYDSFQKQVKQKLFEKVNEKLNNLEESLFQTAHQSFLTLYFDTSKERDDFVKYLVSLSIPDIMISRNMRGKGFPLRVSATNEESLYVISQIASDMDIDVIQSLEESTEWGEDKKGHWVYAKVKKSGYWEKVKRDPKTGNVIEYLNSNGDHKVFTVDGKEVPRKKNTPKPNDLDVEYELAEDRKNLTERCWSGYKPVPGKKAYSKGSCEKK